MQDECPCLETIIRRLASCPPEFNETCQGQNSAKQACAIIADHFRFHDGLALASQRTVWLSNMFGKKSKLTDEQIRWCGMLSVSTWLLHDAFFLNRRELVELSWKWLTGDSLQQLSKLVRPDQVISDSDRREELVRLCLDALGLIPRGETQSLAADRLATLDSVKRQRILLATASAEKRAREVREAMARARALESASRYGE